MVTESPKRFVIDALTNTTGWVEMTVEEINAQNTPTNTTFIAPEEAPTE